MRKSPYILICFLLSAIMAACTHERKVDIAANLHPERMATMTTENVSTLISDSGRIQYKILAPLWKVYDETDTPYWVFPKGLYLQKYDRNFKVIATVAADSAIYYSQAKLWRLEGNVEMRKQPSDLFLSERLFWDQRHSRIYSDTFMHIENQTHVIEGVGFESNDRLTSYRVLLPKGIFPVKNKEEEAPAPAASNGAIPTPAQ